MGNIYIDKDGNEYEEVDEDDVLDMSDGQDEVIGSIEYMLETGGYNEWLKRIFDLSEYAVVLKDVMVDMMDEHPELDPARYEVVIRRI